MSQSFYADLLKDFPVVVVQDVVWGEMDAYQHVNNVVYFRYFENARLECLRRIGFDECQKTTGVGPILRDTTARFRLPLTFPDTIAIGARVTRVEDDRFELEHKIVSRQMGAVVTEGTGMVVSYDYRAGKKAPLPEVVKEGIRNLAVREGT
jgi:acyl-CoA thioester hydrolase